ncbi:unnamed protein product [Wuchereria bancrofti]|uniref:Uncharacterized protein n=2 Tax=Wuchereria bancrofti TaxID=6293 RepID=A0A3P7FA89_WUCBA|nr:unnamed protein product [Wuchereria bancrofti]
MRMECAADGPIKTDDLHHLREGDIFIDSESGQKFRVRKTALPQQSIGGPHGVGDPNDRSLRRLEADVLIPNRMNEQVQKVECREPLEGWIPLSGAMYKKRRQFYWYEKMPERVGALRNMSACELSFMQFLSNCVQYELAMFNDPWFRQKITDEYIKERAEFRRTGKNVMERRWEDYCEYKKKRGDWVDLGDHNK